MNATLLPDDPTVTWKPQIIAKHILKQVHSLDIDTIITFDRDGVSHHANHCALFYSSISIYVANLLQEGIKIPSDSPPKIELIQYFSTLRMSFIYLGLGECMPEIYLFV